MQVDVGRVLGHGRFEVLSRLGEGAGGLVYEVRDRQSDAHLALKTVRLHQPSALASLKREFRAVQDVAHPNLVRLDELFEENGAWFFTMELVEGKDWLSYVRPEFPAGAVDEARLRSSIAQIVEALSVLHATGTVHRDVKPSNVLVSSTGHVKLIDFGIATGAHRLQPQAEGIVGTAAFMAPEQALSEEPSPAWDLYAVGVMLYQALAGRLPFFDHPGSVLEAKLHGAPTRLRSVEPNAPEDLAELCDALLRPEPDQRPDAAASLAIIGARSLASSAHMKAATEEFVGRADELDALQRAFAKTRQGGTVTAIVEGVSGVGKSALVRRFLREIEGVALVFQGKCNEREYVPYNGVDAIVDGLATHLVDGDRGLLDGLSARAMHLLPRLFPVLKRVPFFAEAADAQPPSTAQGSPQELRARIFEAFRELLTRVADRQPLVLAIDDVQWADGDTLALLSELLAPPFPPRILLLCSRRLSEEESLRASLPPSVGATGDVRRIRVGVLPSGEVADLLAQLSSATTLERVALEAIATECGGHPLFLQELVRLSARGDSLPTGPVRLDDALWARVELLGEKERNIVHAIAVAGVPTSQDLIADAASVARRELPSLMATLRGANIVKVSGAGLRRRVEAYHDRLRESVTSRLGDDVKRSWHERLARAYEANGERDVERLAVHWDGAGEAQRSALLYQEAAERASASLAFDRAADFYRRSLELGGTSKSEREVVEHSLAIALINAGRSGEAAHVFLSLARRSSSHVAIELRGRAANAFLVSGHFAEGAAELRAVLDAVGIPFPASRLAVIFMILWQRLLLKLRGLGFVARPTNTIDQSTLTRIDVCWDVAHGFGMTDATTGGAFHALGARLSLNGGDTFRAARALSAFALTASIAGRKGRKYTGEILRKVRDLNATLHDPYIEAFNSAGQGFGAFMLEDWPKADKAFREAILGFRERCVGATYELGTVRNMLGRALAHRGRFVELQALMAPTLRDAIRRKDLFNVINVRMTAGALLALAHGDTETAQSEIDETESLLSSQGFQLQHVYWLLSAGLLDLYRGAPEATLARFEAHHVALKRSLLESVQSVRVMTTHLQARAHLALAQRGGEARRGHLDAVRRAARQLRSEKLPAAEAFATLLDGTVALLRTGAAGGTDLLRLAAERFEKADMKIYAAATRHHLGGILGGEEGKRLKETARVCFEQEKVVAFERFVALCAPGFEGESRRA